MLATRGEPNNNNNFLKMSSRETVAFSEDAAYLAVVLKDGQVKVWDTAKRKLTQTFSPVTGKSPVSCLAWSKEVITCVCNEQSLNF